MKETALIKHFELIYLLFSSNCGKYDFPETSWTLCLGVYYSIGLLTGIRSFANESTSGGAALANVAVPSRERRRV
jgi:hypothetical protein